MIQRSLYILLLFSLFNCFSQGLYAQQPIKKQRVSQIQNYSYNNANVIFRDSTVYSYSGEHGSVFDPYSFTGREYYGQFGYNSIYAVQPAISKATAEVPFHSIRYLDVQHDSVVVYNMSASHKMELQYNEYVRYEDSFIRYYERSSASNRFRYNIDEVNGIFPAKYSTTLYDAAKKEWRTEQTHVVTYNDRGLVNTDSFYGNRYSGYVRHYYDNAGRPIEESYFTNYASNVENYQRHIVSYNANGKIIKEIMLGQLNTNTPEMDTAELILTEYDAQDRVVRVKQLSPGATGMRPGQEYFCHYNADGDADTLTRFYYNSNVSIEYIYKSVFYYNSFHQPDSVYTTARSTGTSVIVPTHYRAYYTQETYEVMPDTPVTPITGPIIIYPNPASNMFRVRWNGQLPARPVYVTIYAGNGQLARRAYIARPQQDDVVDISGLASAMYYIRIVTDSGGLLYTGNLSIAR